MNRIVQNEAMQDENHVIEAFAPPAISVTNSQVVDAKMASVAEMNQQ